MNNLNIPKKILHWYDNNKRQLPWRKKTSKIQKEYFILISEIMLQQTQVKTVIPYFNNFVSKIPSIKSLSKVQNTKLMKCWEGLGYYSRARNLKKAAKKIINEFNGRLPHEEEELKTLPGIGEYTSKAIMAIAFNKKIIPLDGNVERVLKRVFYLKNKEDISKENLHKKKSFFGETNRSSDYAQAIMEIGALIGKPINPICNQCPISKYCKSYKKRDFQIFSINKFNKKKYFEVSIFKNKLNKYLLIKNHQFNFLKDLPIFPMNEISKLKFKNHLGKRMNIKMSNMDMRIALKKVKNYNYKKKGFYIEGRDHINLTLPSFTKKIFSNIKKI
tara:strand:- start:754 stop:1746 length:993 start_codon:yes stop_codon:yes gene_type:complete